MTIVQMRQDNGAPGTCRQSELHFVMDRNIALFTTMLLAWQNAAHKATAWT